MQQILYVVIEKGEKYYIAKFADLPIFTQAESLDELMKNIQEAFDLYTEEDDDILQLYGINKHPNIIANFTVAHATI